MNIAAPSASVATAMDRNDDLAIEQDVEHPDIALPHPLEIAFEAGMEAAEPSPLSLFGSRRAALP